MKTFITEFWAFVGAHFEMLILVFMFVFATAMLAAFPGRDEMARWIEGGAIITIIARSMGLASKQPIPPNTTNSTTIVETTQTPKKNDQTEGELIP